MESGTPGRVAMLTVNAEDIQGANAIAARDGTTEFDPDAVYKRDGTTEFGIASFSIGKGHRH